MARPDEAWLTHINEQFSHNDVPPRQRPWLAWRAWALESGQFLPLGHVDVDHIFRWFDVHTQSGAQRVGPLYTGAFYFDAVIWPVIIEVFYGTTAISPLETLKATPAPVLQRLTENAPALAALTSVCADCFDYVLQSERGLPIPNPPLFASELFSGADKALRACAELLLLNRPSPKALELARDATEIFLKAFLAARDGLTPEEAIKLRHHLDRCLSRCQAIISSPDLVLIGQKIHVLPDISERYRATDWTPRQLWSGYRLAQFTGVTVLRLISGQDLRRQHREAV